MRSDALASPPAVRPQSKGRSHPPTPADVERDAQSSQTRASQEVTSASEDRSAVPCSICGDAVVAAPGKLCDFCFLIVELGWYSAVCISTENEFDGDLTRVVIVGRCVKAGHEYTGRVVA